MNPSEFLVIRRNAEGGLAAVAVSLRSSSTCGGPLEEVARRFGPPAPTPRRHGLLGSPRKSQRVLGSSRKSSGVMGSLNFLSNIPVMFSKIEVTLRTSS